MEIHHLRQLANGGSDTIQNAVVVCPNCHREFHFGSCKPEQTQKLYQEK
ncbi:MAG: HNH endonuclease [Candidatus Poribacteria bacterium]|nr:HNH endonuclease [Candidatus Poribacteria bacterium]